METKMKRLLLLALISISIASSQVVLANELSPTKVKEIERAMSNLESAVTSKSQNGIEKSTTDIQNIGQDAIPKLEILFKNKSKDASIRHKAMEVTAKLKDEKVAESFLSITKDKSEEGYNRKAGLYYTGVLIHELKNNNKRVDKKYMKDVEEVIEDESNDNEIRETAIGIYGQIGQNDALPLLIKKLDDSNKPIMINAIYGIGAIQTPESDDALFNGFSKHMGANVEGVYVHLLGVRKMTKAVPYIIDSLNKLTGTTMEIAAKRGNYINALGEIGDKSTMPFLKAIADNPDVTYNSLSAAEHASVALAKMGDYETIKKVINRIEIDGRAGVGNARSLRNAYKQITGMDFN
jgi:HEAT repeat protein